MLRLKSKLALRSVTFEDIFLMAYGCWLTLAIIGISSMYLYVIPWFPFTYMRYVCILGMAVTQLEKYGDAKNKELIGLGIGAIVVVSLMHFWGSIYCESLLVVLVAYKADFHKIAKVSEYVVLILLVFIILSSLAGIILNYNYRTWNDTRDRYGLGFRYATYATHYILLVVLLEFFLKREEISFKHMILLTLLNLYVYSQSHSRNSMLLSFVVLLCAIVFKYTNFTFADNLFNRIVIAGSYFYLTVLQVILAAIYDPKKKWMATLNKFTSERMRLNAHAYQTYKFTLLGQVTEFEARAWQNGVYKRVGSEYTGMDSSYLDILYRNGVVSLLFFLIIFTVAGLYALKHKDRYLTVILFIVAAHSTFDPQLNLLQYNTFMIIVFSITVGAYREKAITVFRRVFRKWAEVIKS